MNRSESGSFVVYDHGQYAGLLRRMVAIIVDLVGLLFLWVLATLVADLLGATMPEDEDLPGWFVAVLGALSFSYLTVLKRSRIRTPGFWLTGLKIVDLRGRPPSMLLMSLRLFLWILGPINPILDWLFISNEKHRQTVRDKLVGTYVVRKDAEPVAHGQRVYSRWSLMGFMFAFPEVQPEPSREGAATS